MFDVFFLKQVLYIFSTRIWPEIKGSRDLGEVEHQEALFDIYLQCQCDFKCSSLFTACTSCTVPVTSPVFIPTQMWPENKISSVPGGI